MRILKIKATGFRKLEPGFTLDFIPVKTPRNSMYDNELNFLFKNVYCPICYTFIGGNGQGKTSTLALISLCYDLLLENKVVYRSLDFSGSQIELEIVFFEKGKLNISEMERQRFSVTDLMEAIRNNGNSSLSEVDYVIMETNGDISVIPSSLYRPVTPKDLNLKPEEDFVSYIIIDGGKVYENNLNSLGFDKNWLMKQLKKEKINSIKDVFYFSANKNGETFLMKKE